MLYLIDLFCGAGGFSTGVANVPDCEVILAIDFWDEALETHKTNHPNTKHILFEILPENSKELAKIILNAVKTSAIGKNDILHIHASPPCQNLSSMNSKRSNCIEMTAYMLRFLSNFSTLYLKNTPFNYSWTLEQVNHPILRDFFTTANICFWNVYDMSKHDVCQSRVRIIASNIDILKPMQETQKESKSIKALFQNLAPINTKYLGNTNITVNTWTGSKKNTYTREYNDKSIGYTVVSTPAWFLNEHKELIEPLKDIHNILLQTFPASYFDCVKRKASKRTQIANSVPPNFASAVIKSVQVAI